jgi:hypothetical protein
VIQKRGESTFLRRALLADAVISGATGLLMLTGASLLETWLGVPAALMRVAGVVLLPFAGLVVYLSKRSQISRSGVWTVIALNVAWVAGSVLLLVSRSIEPTTLGIAFIGAQSLAVAFFAEVQYVGLRKVIST